MSGPNPDRRGALSDSIGTVGERPGAAKPEEARCDDSRLPLDQNELPFRQIVETLNDGLAVQDEGGKLSFANEALCSMLGYAPAEVLGCATVDFVDEPQRAFFVSHMNDGKRPNRRAYELTLVAKDGARVHTMASPAPMYDSAGRFAGSFAIITDLRERKRAEETLAEERNLLRTLTDNLPDYIYVKDRQSRFLMTNRAHLEALGLTEEAQVIGKTDFDLHAPAMAQQYFDDERQVIESGQPLLHKVERIETRQGAKWLLTTKTPLTDLFGEVVGVVGIGRDITGLRKVEAALRESEERLRIILENSRDIAYKFSLESKRFEYLSPSVNAVLGYSPEEITGMDAAHLTELLHPEDSQRVQDDLASLVPLRPDAPDAGIVEFRIRHKDGHYRWVAKTSAIVPDDEGQPATKVGTLRDITQGKQAEQALRMASRMEATATLAGGIAHDFNNLMVGVLGNAELLQMHYPNEPEAGRKLTNIIEAAQRAGELSQQMLAFARGGKYQPRAIDLNNVLLDVLRFEKRAFPPRIAIERDADPELWGIVGDPAQISQVVTNLLINAVEAIEETGRIVITTRNIEIEEAFAKRHPGLAPGRYVYVAVEDTGCGMDSATLARVFEPFFTTKFQGRGLGLSAAYGILKNHNGHISAYSQEGLGSSFKLYLPAVEAPVAQPKAEPRTVPRGNETVLLVDDDEFVVGATREILEDLGYRVLCAGDGQQAIAMAEGFDGNIHVILLDMGMPIMGGAQAYPRLKRARPDARVIVCSGYELDPAAQAMLDNGASAFVQKPFRAKQLAATIRGALGG